MSERTTRTHKEVGSDDAASRRELMHAILADVRALERMLRDGWFETGVRRIGAEQELFLVDQAYSPADGVLAMLD